MSTLIQEPDITLRESKSACQESMPNANCNESELALAFKAMPRLSLIAAE